MGQQELTEPAAGASDAAGTDGRKAKGKGNGGPTRARILRIASEIFAQNGFDATGIQELSDAIGLGRGALYYHIKSKDQLLFEICVTALDEVIVEAEQIVARDEPFEEKLHALARALIVDLAERRAAWTVSLSELRALPEERREEVVARRDRYEQLWAGLLAEGHKHGVIGKVDSVVLRGILGLLNSTHLWIQTKPRSPERIADDYTDLILNGIRSRGGVTIRRCD